METIDHILAGAIVAISIVQAFADPEVLKRGPRMAFYKAGAATGILLSAVVLLLWYSAGRPMTDFEIASWLGRRPLVTLALAAVWAAILAGAFRLSVSAWREPLTRYYAKYRHLMPARRRELAAAYAAGSLAGTGEEIAFRGFLLWYLSAFAGLLPAALLTSAIFGIAHGYQGRTGMLFASLAGLLLATVYLLSGSLLLVIWMHASYNVASFTLGYRLIGSSRPTTGAVTGSRTGPPPQARAP